MSSEVSAGLNEKSNHMSIDTDIVADSSSIAGSETLKSNSDGIVPEQISKKRKIEDGDEESQGVLKEMKVDKFLSSDRAARSGVFDDEAEEDSEDGDESGDEVDVDNENNYVYDDFVVKDDDDGSDADDNDEEGDDDDEEDVQVEKKKKLKRLVKRSDDLKLDADDLDLIQENLEDGFVHQDNGVDTNEAVEIGDGDDENASNYDDDDDDLFVTAPTDGPDKTSSVDRKAAASADRARRVMGYDDDSDLDDFLVDDELPEGFPGEDGTMGAQPLPRQQKQRSIRRDGPTYDQIKDATDIFGDGFDDFDDEADEAGVDEDVAYGDEDNEDMRWTVNNKAQKDRKARERLVARYDRSVLVENFLTESDDRIRQTDRPERHQDILEGRELPSEVERLDEATWMAAKIFQQIMLEEAARRRNDPNAGYNRNDDDLMLLNPEQLKEVEVSFVRSCQSFLEFYQIDQLEIPFIWTYRREYFHEKIGRAHLWQMMSLDELWEKLVTAKNRLFKLLQQLEEAASGSGEGQQLRRYEEREARAGLREHLRAANVVRRRISDAEEAYQTAIDTLEDIDDDEDGHSEDDDQVNSAKGESGNRTTALKAQIASAESVLHELREELVAKADESEKLRATVLQMRARRRLGALYDPESASRVLRLFPRVRYEALILNARDEQELRDISSYLSMLLKSCEPVLAKTAGARSSSRRRKDAESARGSGDAEAEDEAMETETGVQSFIDGEENDEDEDNDDDDLLGDFDDFDASKPRENSRGKTIASGKDEYRKFCRVKGLRELIDSFMAPASDVGDAVRYGYKVEPPATLPYYPEDAALMLLQSETDGQLKSADAVWRAVIVVVASEMANEPSIRAGLRKAYRTQASISTLPTVKGLSTITPFSELFGLHYLDRKPVSDFLDGRDKTLFLRLISAEKKGLITVTVNAPPLAGASNSSPLEYFLAHEDIGLFKTLLPSLSKDQEGDLEEHRKKWDRKRLDIVQFMLESIVLPSMKAELRREIVRASREAVIAETYVNFSQALAVGPYRVPAPAPKMRVKETLLACSKLPSYLTVASIVVGAEREAVHMAYVDKRGVVKQTSVIPEKATNRKPEFLVKFIFETRPDVIVVNSSGGTNSKLLMKQLETLVVPKVVETIINRAQTDMDYDEAESDIYKPQMAIIKDDLALIFKNSPRAKKGDFLKQQYAPGVGAAICLARYAQEPLAEYCALWGSADSVETFGYEALFLNFHPLKDLIKGSRMPILRALTRALVDAVNEVGVDLNMAVRYDHKAPLLAFVSGLGLRKANYLIRNITRTVKKIDSRKELLDKGFMGPNIYTNAAGFLRIRDSEFDEAGANVSRTKGDAEKNPDGEEEEEEEDNGEEYIFAPSKTGYIGSKSTKNPLDDTRIHPECYAHKDTIVQKICLDAQDDDKLANNNAISDPNDPRLIRNQMKISKAVLAAKIDKYPEWVDLWINGRPVGETYSEHRTRNNNTEWVTESIELKDNLDLLALDDYAEELERVDSVKRKYIMRMIKEELRYPWLDLRLPMTGLTDEDLFSAITGDTDYTLHVGLKIGCTVLDINEGQDPKTGRRRQSALVRTDAGLRGFISAYEVTDDRIDPEYFSITDIIQTGMHFPAVVIRVNKMRTSVDLSIKPSVLERTEDWWVENRRSDKTASAWWFETSGRAKESGPDIFDSRFREDKALAAYRALESVQRRGEEIVMNPDTGDVINVPADSSSAHSRRDHEDGGYDDGGGRGDDSQVTRAARAAVLRAQALNNSKNRLIMRQIVHPLFVNCSFKEAEDRLRMDNKGAGEVLFRPSSKGVSMIAITWAFQENWFRHIDVEELDKRDGDLGLGSQLVIQETDMKAEVFSDLDEIYARYIQPMNDFVSSITSHKSFHPGSVGEVEAAMKQQLVEQPTRVPYFLRFEPQRPGCFALTWMSLNTQSTMPVKKELVFIRPTGYKLTSRETFERPSELIDFFKKAVSASRRPVSSRPPPSVEPSSSAASGAVRKTRFSSAPAAADVTMPAAVAPSMQIQYGSGQLQQPMNMGMYGAPNGLSFSQQQVGYAGGAQYDAYTMQQRLA